MLVQFLTRNPHHVSRNPLKTDIRPLTESGLLDGYLAQN